jgi:hypothetical protein
MKTLLIILVSVMGFGGVHASVKLTGFVGKYEISMELVASTASKDYNVRGRYNYAGKTQSLDLKGNMYEREVLHLIESFEGKKTGEFYLESFPAGKWQGKWIGKAKVYDAVLQVDEDSWVRELEPYSIKNYNWETTPSWTGSYVDDQYWLNDIHSTEARPAMEVGFRGGIVTVEELSEDKIAFHLQRTCGPDYQLAIVRGTATLLPGPEPEENGFPRFEFRYKELLTDQKEACELKFVLEHRVLNVSQISSSASCGFEANAFAQGSYVKVNEAAVKAKRGELTVKRALGR